ncbi:MAG TPA: ADOP family duplicated permease, partial [Gammaproteobacteria bacterium]|nr:ADOP family duplicated permease [Gammaproteobacteria bacterium]
RLSSVIASASLFNVLGVQPMLGRSFTAANMKAGNDRVAVISYGLWRTGFGASPDAVGKSVRINGDPFRVIGVMPPGFAFPDRGASLWLPRTIGATDFDSGRFIALSERFIGRLKPGVAVDAAAQQVQQAVSTWTHNTFPIQTGGGFRLDQELLQSVGFNLQAQPYHQVLLGDRPATLWLLQGAVLLILLITCVNVANLLLSRILARGQEIAMRSTLGATRVVLVRQLLAEALCLAAPGGLIGIGLCWLALYFMDSSWFGAGNSIFHIALDWRVGLFTLGAVLFTAALVSVLPIRHLAKTDLQLVLQEGSRTSGGGRGAKRARNALVIAELTLATGLLAIAGLVLHSFMNLQAVDPGFHKDHMLIAGLLVSPEDHPGNEALRSFYSDLVKRVDELPGVNEAAVAQFVPLSGQDTNFSMFTVLGRKPVSGKPPGAMFNAVSAEFFKTLGIPILRGRPFDARDKDTTHAIVDTRLVEKYFPDTDPIGQTIVMGQMEHLIIGVVPSIKYAKLTQAEPSVVVYVNGPLMPPTRQAQLVIHTELPPGALINPVRKLLSTIDSNVAVYDMHTMGEQLSNSHRDKETTMTLLLAFGGIALALAIVGVYAVMSYAVGQRRAECGLRLALGAVPEDLSWLVLKDGLRLLVVGLVVGLGLAVLCGYLISAQLFGVAPFDPVTLIGSAAVLCVITLTACYLPARRAAKLDPAVAIMEQ